MNDTKPWWASRTIWGIAVAAAVVIAQHCGLVAAVSDADSQEAVNAVLNIVAGAASLAAIYGRVKAKAQIGKTKQ